MSCSTHVLHMRSIMHCFVLFSGVCAATYLNILVVVIANVIPSIAPFQSIFNIDEVVRI